jgi:hypothetical protein
MAEQLEHNVMMDSGVATIVYINNVMKANDDYGTQKRVMKGGFSTRNEVILKGADSTFGSVAAVEMWWYQLEFDFLAV